MQDGFYLPVTIVATIKYTTSQQKGAGHGCWKCKNCGFSKEGRCKTTEMSQCQEKELSRKRSDGGARISCARGRLSKKLKFSADLRRYV
jgi:hypothetical protein